MIAAYFECFGVRGVICRFGNVVGPRGTHGAILDFCKKLKAHPDHLDVLGDGRQAKPYLHVTDCVSGILHVVEHARGEKPAIFNLAPPDWTSVARIAELCVAASPNARARIEFSGGTQGWPGAIPVLEDQAAQARSARFQGQVHVGPGGRAGGPRGRARGVRRMKAGAEPIQVPVDPEVELLVPEADAADPEVSIVIPALNEQLTIGDFIDWCHEGLRKAGAEGEVLIVDSGTDKTREIALSKGARVLRAPRRGLGRAYIDSLPYIRGKYVLMGTATAPMISARSAPS